MNVLTKDVFTLFFTHTFVVVSFDVIESLPVTLVKVGWSFHRSLLQIYTLLVYLDPHMRSVRRQIKKITKM